MFQRRASPRKGWGQTGSPGKERHGAATYVMTQSTLNQPKRTADRFNQSTSRDTAMKVITAQPSLDILWSYIERAGWFAVKSTQNTLTFNVTLLFIKNKFELSWTNLRTICLHHMAEHEEGDVKEQGPYRCRFGWGRDKSSMLVCVYEEWGKEFPHRNMPLLYLNSHPSPLMCLGNSLSLEQIEKKKKLITRTRIML